MKRALLLLHRYSGIAICLMVAAWCLSGIVMMYVHFPSLSPVQRLIGLAPLSMEGCCALDEVRAVLGDASIDGFRLEMLAGKPVLRVTMPAGETSVDLRSGRALDAVSPLLAQLVAEDYVANTAIGHSPQLLRRIERDQWTVSGEYNAYRPLYQFSLRDAAGTEIYVSGKSGEVVQQTTRRQRIWNYFGAVTHWIYPTALRQHVAAWSQVVIWTSLIGVFLVLTGLYAGWIRWNPRGSGRFSPFRGWMLWHHVAGLLFGVLALSWVGSGLISMNPWGFLDGGSSSQERAQLAGMRLSAADALATVQTWLTSPRTTAELAGVRQLSGAPFDGALYIMALTPESAVRLDARLAPAPMAESSLRSVGARLRPGAPIIDSGLLASADHYYYAHHYSPPFPVYRVLLGDAQATRYYIDPADGTLLRKIDQNGRWWRWLFSALHQWDFAAPLRQRPLWDLVVVALLLGLTTLSLSGVWLAIRHVKHSL